MASQSNMTTIELMQKLGGLREYMMPSSSHIIETIKKKLEGFSTEDRTLVRNLVMTSCHFVMAENEYLEKQKQYPDNDPCCQVYDACEFYNKPWFIYAAGGAAVFLAILITAAVTSGICCCMKKKSQ